MKAAVPDWLVEKSYRAVGHRKELLMEKARLCNPWIYAVLLRVRLALDGVLWVLLVWAALSGTYPHPFSLSTQELCSPEPLTNREARQDTCAWKGVLSVTAPLFSLLVGFSSYKR